MSRTNGTANVIPNNNQNTLAPTGYVNIGTSVPSNALPGNVYLTTNQNGYVSTPYKMEVGLPTQTPATLQYNALQIGGANNNQSTTLGNSGGTPLLALGNIPLGNSSPNANGSILTPNKFSVGVDLVYSNNVLTIGGTTPDYTMTYGSASSDNSQNFVDNSVANVGSYNNLVNPTTGLAGTYVLVGPGTYQHQNPYMATPSNPTGTNNQYLDQGTFFSDTAQRQAASAYFAGGVGIEQDLVVGGYIYGRIESASSATQSKQITVINANNNEEYFPTFVSVVNATTAGGLATLLYGDTATNHLTYNPDFDNQGNGRLTVDNLAIAGTVYGDTVLPDSILDNIYTNYLGMPAQNSTISVGAGMLDVFGEIRVRGKDPKGTGPVVTNTLYVTVDGDDTNDGRALDPSRACRTIGGAMQSPYYQPGTQILVSAGHYYENNPLVMKPYTSIRGSDIRTTFIEPINKTQDLFHLQSGCYLNYMTFLNGRSGRLPGQYDPGFNRGAYATAFPPSVNGSKIDLFHSPYIQNCTNQTGPWLKDGTMFVPDQTIQVPSVVGTGTWAANTTTIVVTVNNPPLNGWINVGTIASSSTDYTSSLYSTLTRKGSVTNSNYLSVVDPSPTLYDAIVANDTGDLWVYTGAPGIALGQSVSSGQQNQGFFNARTLLLANKPFLQSQTVAYLDAAFNSASYYANPSKTSRDTGLIINAIANDLLYFSQSDSTFAGLQYWQQTTATVEQSDPYPSAEIQATISATNYLSTLVQALPGISSTSSARVAKLFSTITNIIANGAVNITNQVQYGGLPTTNVNTVSDYNLILSYASTLTNEVQSYIANTLNFTAYSTATCKRDVGYILDSVAFDLLHGGNIQSIKSGTYYYQYSNVSALTTSSVLGNQIPQCTAVINFISNYIPDIITGQLIANPLQNAVTQTTSTNIGSSYQVSALQDSIDYIIQIINEGPSVAGPKTPQSLIENTASYVINSYNLLTENIAFLGAEAAAFSQTLATSTATFNRQLCYRDTGILIENMAYDMTFGGNEKSVESGLAYYNGVTSVIPGLTSQCVSSIYYLNQLCQQVVVNSTCTVLPLAVSDDIPLGTQVINSNLTGGAIAQSSIENLFNTTISIIEQGPSSAPQSYVSPGPDAAFISAEILLQANRTFIQEQTINYINWNLCNPPKALPYNQIKCARDVGVIVDSIGVDLVFPTPTYSQSNFAGVQYYAQNGYLGQIPEELDPTIDAFTYLENLCIKVAQNITAATDAQAGVYRYTTATQITTSTGQATSVEIATLGQEFGTILTILKGNTTGWTDQIVANGVTSSTIASTQITAQLLLENTNYLAGEVLGFVSANYPGFTYSTSTCARDVGFIINSVVFDLLYGGNRQSIQAGLSYYSSNSADPIIPQEVAPTAAAFTELGTLVKALVTATTLKSFTANYTLNQTVVAPVIGLPVGSAADAAVLQTAVSTITNIITNGPNVAAALRPVSLNQTTSTTAINAFNIIEANRSFIQAEIVAWINNTYNPNSFNYDQALCYRDTGLLVDAVSQDIILGGNSNSIQAGLSYWNQAYNYVANQINTTTAAINYIASIASQIIANTTVTTITGTVATQVINPFFGYGNTYMPQQAVARNFNIISNIIENGPSAAPIQYAGGGLVALTGLNGSSVNISPTITELVQLTTNTFLVGLSTATVGFGTNATLYFGNTEIFPYQDSQVQSYSLQYTGSTSTWNIRTVDQIGAMGGSLVDGSVISDTSPIQSFVYDAFTQVNQGGIGIHITNNGYAQLVSVFTIFCDTAVLADNGGLCSITNSNCNFGNYGLVSKGYGKRAFSGTIYNPLFRAYPFSPGTNGLDQYYPQGYWPNNGSVEVFVPDLNNRPHITLIMEVIPPTTVPSFTNTNVATTALSYTTYLNNEGFPGFLNAQPSTSTLVAGTINLVNIDTTDVYIGNSVYIVDQFGYQYDHFQYKYNEFGQYVSPSGNVLTTQTSAAAAIYGAPNPNYGIWYAATGTVVTDVNFNSITLNQALTNGGGFGDNPNYFTIYFCGNAYYTVETSQVANQPYLPGTNILSSATTSTYQGPTVSQIAAHIGALQHLSTVTNQIIANIAVTPTTGNTSTQVINQTVIGGAGATAFIDLRFQEIINIIGAANLAQAESVVPQNQITTSGTIPTGAGAAATLIQDNLNFLTAEIVAWVQTYYQSAYNGQTMNDYQAGKCVRDTALILQQIIYDLGTGGNYNSVYAGLSYWSRPGTYHIVSLGEAVTNPALFPDGAIVNFYQRSYISASGYLFEYVGAGANYGALPQRGVADPIQAVETISLNSGKVFFTSTDQNGDFRIGTGLVISQATGVLSGRTFVQSLYAYMTPFILAIE